MRKLAWAFALMLCLSMFAGLTTNVTATAPDLNFTASVTSGYAPLTVTFSGTSTSNITGWLWDFDYDGMVDATTQNATYTYTAPGTYTVQLGVVDNASNIAQLTKNNLIVVLGPVIPSSTARTSGKYSDGSLWNVSQPLTLNVNTSKYVLNATGYFQWVLPDPGMASGTFSFYVTLYWQFNGQTISTHLIGSDHSDQERVYQAGIGGIITNGNTTFKTNVLGFIFNQGDGNYTLTATMQIYTTTGYSQSVSSSAVFNCTIPGLLPFPHISNLFIQIAGIVGVLAMILAIPMFFWMTSRYNWLFGLSTTVIMGLIGFVLFNVFILNAGSI
jgi:PKD repeat protein